VLAKPPSDTRRVVTEGELDLGIDEYDFDVCIYVFTSGAG